MEVELVKISPCRLYVCLKQCHAEPNHLSALCSTIRHNPACKRQHSLCRPEGWPGSRWVSRWPSGTCSCNRQHARGKPEANLCYSGHGGTNLQQKKKKKKKREKRKVLSIWKYWTDPASHMSCCVTTTSLLLLSFTSAICCLLSCHFAICTSQTNLNSLHWYFSLRFLGLKQAICHPTPWKIFFYILFLYIYSN